MSMNRREFLQLSGLGTVCALGLPLNPPSSEGEHDFGQDIAMLYDSTKCVGCNACTIACRDWNNTTIEKDPTGKYDAPQDLSGKTWTLIKLYEDEAEFSFVKRQCMHCLLPSCVSACPVQALQKTETGAVVYDAKRCIGCRYCMVACPFGVPRYEWDKVIPRVAKCTLCSDRLVSGDGPSCAEACPSGALIWGTRAELVAEAEARLAAHPDLYVGHVYGKDDVGGTSVIYLSHVPFDKLGFPDLGNQPHPELSDAVAAMGTPGALIGVAATLAAVYWLTKRQQDE